MARPRAALLAVLGMLAVGAALAAPRQFSRPDPLEGVKTAIRLKKFTEAATALQGAAAARQGRRSSLLPAAQLKDPGVRREALWLAATDGDVPSLEILADPALVSARDEFGRGALARAAEAGAAPAVALLIRRGAAGDAADEPGIAPPMLGAPAGGAAGRGGLAPAAPQDASGGSKRRTRVR